MSVANARLLASAAANRLRFVPNANYFGGSTVTLRAWDQTTGTNGGLANTTTSGGTTAFSSATDTAAITVLSVNDVPSFTKGGDQVVAEDAGAQTVAGWATALSRGPANESGQTLAFAITGNSNAGLFSAGPTVSPTGTLTFTPAANANGTATISLVIADNGGTANGGIDTSAAQSFVVSVSSVNDAPACADDAASTDEDTPLNDSLACTDVEGATLTYAEVTGPSDGMLLLNPDGTFTYTPDPDFNGSDSFTFTADDGSAVSNVATFTITVPAVNDAPVCADDAANTNEDTPLAGTVSCTDVDGDALTYSEATGPSDGALVLNPDGSFTYTPDADFNGSDSFTFSADDGTETSNTATFTITVAAVNDAPVCADDADSTDEDTPLAGSVTCTDVDGDALTYASGTDPANGTLTLNPDGTFTYTPDPDFTGTDSFTFSANDGADGSNTATFTITVAAANDAPVCADDAATTDEDTPLAGSLVCTDVEGDGLAYAEVSGPTNGTLVLASDGTFTYTPDADFTGTDSFTFTADDGSATSNAATFTITVTAVNDAPVCADDAGSTEEETPLAGSVTCTDVDGDTLTYASATDPANGTLVMAADGGFTYTPDANFIGTDSFTFTADDGTDTSNTATFTITVTAANDAPVCADDAATTDEDTPLGDSLACTDVDGDALTYAEVSGPSDGTLVFNPDGSFTYTPDPDFNGTDSFTFSADDGTEVSNTATFAITVTPVNDAPVCADDAASTNEDSPLAGSVTCTDVDGDTLTYAAVSGPTNGTLTFNPDGTFTYYPDTAFNGSDSFTFSADDGTAAPTVTAVSNTATFTIAVAAVPPSPTPTPDPSDPPTASPSPSADPESGELPDTALPLPPLVSLLPWIVAVSMICAALAVGGMERSSVRPGTQGRQGLAPERRRTGR